jgi:hypothetical protein
MTMASATTRTSFTLLPVQTGMRGFVATWGAPASLIADQPRGH